jgi:excinuclease UvrABC nuclease subunit
VACQARARGGQLMDGAKLHMLYAAGVHGPLRSNIDFVSIEEDVGRTSEFAVYPVGQHVALYRMDDGKMRFLGRVSDEVTAHTAPCTGLSGRM